MENHVSVEEGLGWSETETEGSYPSQEEETSDSDAALPKEMREEIRASKKFVRYHANTTHTEMTI